MSGGLGNDSYFVDVAGDVTLEGAAGGTDTLYASVNFTLSAGSEIETLRVAGAVGRTLTGNELGQSILGNRGSDTLRGMAGADTLFGGLGKDTLTGGLGADRFVFATRPAVANLDTITDFSKAQADRVVLDRSIFTAVGPAGHLAIAAFFKGTVAHDASDRIIYNNATGALFYDSDGTGAAAAIQIAKLAAGLSLTHTSFDVIA
jgi:Ca2+-binding RTX toxin-like protein